MLQLYLEFYVSYGIHIKLPSLYAMAFLTQFPVKIIVSI